MILNRSYLESLTHNQLEYFLIRYGIQNKQYSKKNDKIASILMAYIKHNKPKKTTKKLKRTNNIIPDKTNMISMNNILIEDKHDYRVINSGNTETWIKTDDLSKLLQEPTAIFFGIKTTHYPNGKIEQNVDISETYFRLTVPFNALITINDVKKLFKNNNRFAKFELIKTDKIIGDLISVDVWYYGGSAIGSFHGHTNLYKLT